MRRFCDLIVPCFQSTRDDLQIGRRHWPGSDSSQPAGRPQRLSLRLRARNTLQESQSFTHTRLNACLSSGHLTVFYFAMLWCIDCRVCFILRCCIQTWVRVWKSVVNTCTCTHRLCMHEGTGVQFIHTHYVNTTVLVVDWRQVAATTRSPTSACCQTRVRCPTRSRSARSTSASGRFMRHSRASAASSTTRTLFTLIWAPTIHTNHKAHRCVSHSCCVLGMFHFMA